MKKTIREVVESYGVKLWYIGDGILRGACPIHVNINTPSFTVYEHTDSFFCFGESIGGDTANFISHMEGISYAEAKKLVDGEVSFQEDFNMLLDSASVIDEHDYGVQLNFSVSKYCRDMLLDGVPVDKVMAFLRRLDKDVLPNPVTHVIMESVVAESRQLRGGVK
jgi:hypothetical protein